MIPSFRSQMHYILQVALSNYAQEHSWMVESFYWTELAVALSLEMEMEMEIQIQGHHFLSWEASHLSSSQLQILSLSIVFHPAIWRTISKFIQHSSRNLLLIKHVQSKVEVFHNSNTFIHRSTHDAEPRSICDQEFRTYTWQQVRLK